MKGEDLFPLTYYTQLALKHILIIFIICSRECHVNTPRFLSCLWTCQLERDWERKQRRLLWMSMNILRNLAGVNRLKDLWNEPLMLQNFHVPASRGYGRRNLAHISVFLLCRKVFQNHGGFIAASNHKKTIPGYYFNNNCYNIPFVHIIRIVILNCHVTDGWLLKVKIIFY